MLAPLTLSSHCSQTVSVGKGRGGGDLGGGWLPLWVRAREGIPPPHNDMRKDAYFDGCLYMPDTEGGGGGGGHPP